MAQTLTRLPVPLVLAVVLLTLPLVANAQTQPPSAPSTATPNAITPPNGVARGTIRPNRPVHSNMVKHPPTNGQHKMPVIQPPGTAR